MPTIATTGAAAAQAYGSGAVDYISIVQGVGANYFGPSVVTPNKTTQVVIGPGATGQVVNINPAGRAIASFNFTRIGGQSAYITSFLKDSSGNMYVIACTNQAGFSIRKFDSSGNFVADKNVSLNMGAYYVFASIDPSDVIKIAGLYVVYVSSPYNYVTNFVATFDTSLNFTMNEIDTPSSTRGGVFNYEQAVHVSKNSSSSLGFTYATSKGYTVSYSEYDPLMQVWPSNVNWILQRTAGGLSIDLNVDFIIDVYVDNNANIYILWWGIADARMIFAKHDNTGAYQWSKYFYPGGVTYVYDPTINSGKIAVDASGNVYVAMRFTTVYYQNPYIYNTAYPFYLVKYNSAGTQQFARKIYGNIRCVCPCFCCTAQVGIYSVLDANISTYDPNNIYITTASSFSGVTVIKLPTSGNLTQTITFNTGEQLYYTAATDLLTGGSSSQFTKLTPTITTTARTPSVYSFGSSTSQFAATSTFKKL